MFKKIYWGLPYNTRRFLFKLVKPKRYRRFKMKLSSVDINNTSFKDFIEYKTIFVHIPKAAGISFNMSLFDNLGGGHIPLRNYQLVFSKKDFESFYKFTIVRNPWDRLFSAYNFLKKGGLTGNDQEFAKKNINPYKDFNAFVIKWVNKKNINKGIHFKPQYKFLCDIHDNVLTDYIGYFENIENEFQSICEKLNIEKELIKINSNKRTENYKDYYNENTKKIVKEVYKKDIELFGYKF